MYFIKVSIFLCVLLATTEATIQSNNDIEIFKDIDNNTLEDIMNGAVANEDMFPYLVSIQTARQHICGGTIITMYHVLTAAHCTFRKIFDQRFKPAELRIRAGPVNLRHPPDVLAHIIWIKIHEEYRKKPIDNDIAIMKVDRILISDEYDLLPLSSSFITTSSVLGKCTTAGWGRLGPSSSTLESVDYLEESSNLTTVDSLQVSSNLTTVNSTTIPTESSNSNFTNFDTVKYNEVSTKSTELEEGIVRELLLRFTLLPLQKSEDCAKDYENAGITDDVLCAGERNSKTDTCKGDSGGPLICDGKLEGIVSFGDGCDNPGHLGVYTRVYKHLKWIQIIINSAYYLQHSLYFVLLSIILIITI